MRHLLPVLLTCLLPAAAEAGRTVRLGDRPLTAGETLTLDVRTRRTLDAEEAPVTAFERHVLEVTVEDADAPTLRATWAMSRSAATVDGAEAVERRTDLEGRTLLFTGGDTARLTTASGVPIPGDRAAAVASGPLRWLLLEAPWTGRRVALGEPLEMPTGWLGDVVARGDALTTRATTARITRVDGRRVLVITLTVTGRTDGEAGDAAVALAGTLEVDVASGRTRRLRLDGTVRIPPTADVASGTLAVRVDVTPPS